MWKLFLACRLQRQKLTHELYVLIPALNHAYSFTLPVSEIVRFCLSLLTDYKLFEGRFFVLPTMFYQQEQYLEYRGALEIFGYFCK
jgi:hypothetical protein